MRKTFVGPRLRRLRKEREQTQAAMAKTLGVSAAYVNLLENNQRSLSVEMLLRVAESYGVDWRDLVDDEAPARLAELRAALQDPVFTAGERPDLQELRAAVEHSPRLAEMFLHLHKSHRALTERVLALAEDRASQASGALTPAPASAAHDLFLRRRNHFPELEAAAEAFRAETPGEADELFSVFKTWFHERHGVTVARLDNTEVGAPLRSFDDAERRITLSDALDYPNKVFQLAHVAALLTHGALIDGLIAEAGLRHPAAVARCRVELANYAAAAALTPYAAFHAEAERCAYDVDRLAARFGVSVEQVCHRLTTLQREGAAGVPFFFLRVDKAGNVTKRFSATRFHLAEFGGACPRWDVHLSFRNPGRILTQWVELPDGSRYFTVNRTVDRPSLGLATHDERQAVTLGCAAEHATRLAYAEGPAAGVGSRSSAADPTPIGINCRLCPRSNCAQRAHEPAHMELPIDERRRGVTRFES